MRSGIKSIIKSVALILSTAPLTLAMHNHAVAADYGHVSNTASGWYLRGDVFFNSSGKHDDQSSSVDFINSRGTPGNVDAQYSDLVGGSLGFGYRFTDNLRLDINVELDANSDFDRVRGVTVSGLEFASTGASTPVTNVPATETTDASYDSSTLMANAYFDIAKMGRFTPYVGAGAGITRIEFRDNRTTRCTPASNQACLFPSGGAQGVVVEGSSLSVEEIKHVFSYQLAVGGSYQITPRWSLDAGYSYFNAGDGGKISYSDGAGIDTNGYSAHRVKMGLRYEIK